MVEDMVVGVVLPAEEAVLVLGSRFGLPVLVADRQEVRIRETLRRRKMMLTMCLRRQLKVEV